MYEFGQIKISGKDFNSQYQVIESVDLEKIRISEGVVANKNDTRYKIGYEVEPGKIIPLYVKTPKNCVSPGVSRYNVSSPWKMGFNVSEDKEWVEQYKAIWAKIEELMGQKLTGEPLNNGKYINPKLITWEGEIRTSFRGKTEEKYEEIGACHATGILKIESVYRQGSNYYFQVFLRGCKYTKRESSFEIKWSDDEDEDDYVF